MNRKLGLMVSSGLLAAAIGGAAHAQGTPSATLIEEVVVTAERRDQSLQDVPVAVSAFTDERRELVGINSVQDLTNFTPGLAYSTNNDRINMRGIGRFTNNRSSEGGVAMYNDSFYTSSVTSFARSTLFIDRTEVLRGPQGTLYGRNAVGGALNIISKRPTDEFYAEVRAGVGNYDNNMFEAAVSGPLFGNVRGRVAGSWTSQGEGFFENLSGGESEGGRGDQWQIEYQLDGSLGDGKFEWWFKGDTAEWDNIGRGPGGRTTATIGLRETGQVFTGSSPGLTPSPTFGLSSNLPGNECARCFSTDDPNIITLEDVQFTFNAVLHLDNFDIKYIGGHHYYDYRLQTDVDATANRAPYTVGPATPLFRNLTVPAACTVANPTGVANPTYPTLAPGCSTYFNLPLAGVQVFPRQNNQYQEEVWWFSNELNFTSTHDGPVQWLFGLFQYREGSNYTSVDARFPDDPRFENPLLFNVLAPTAVVRAAPNPLRQYAYGNSQNRNESYATFGQVDWQFAETWKLTAGLRYTKDKKESFESARLLCFLSFSAGCPTRAFLQPVDVTQIVSSSILSAQTDRSVVGPVYTDPTTGLRHRLLKNEWSAVTGTLGVDWQPDSDSLYYAKYTRGYKAGGFNAGATTLPLSVTTDEETIDAYEVGMKKTFAEQNLQVNASLFYYDYQNLQAPLSVVDAVLQTSRTEFFNLPKATNKGFELEATWVPIESLQVLFNYSYLDAQIEEACCYSDPEDPRAIAPGASPSGPPTATGERGQDLSGNRLPSSTPHRVTINTNYTFEFEPGALALSATYVWKDETYYSIFNRWYNKAKAYEQVDLRAIFTDADDKFTVIGYVKNVFDKDALSGIGASRINTPGSLQGFINLTPSFINPRTYGVELQYRF